MNPTKMTSPDAHPTSYNVCAQLFIYPITSYHARAIFPIYARTTVALVRVACRHALMKIYESGSWNRFNAQQAARSCITTRLTWISLPSA
jgi:hypothetical protein